VLAVYDNLLISVISRNAVAVVVAFETKSDDILYHVVLYVVYPSSLVFDLLIKN